MQRRSFLPSALLGGVPAEANPPEKGSLICRVEAIPAKVPYRNTFVIGRRLVAASGQAGQYVFVRIETADGHVGWGETIALPSWSYEILTDPGLKRTLWHDSWSIYWTVGAADPDYCVLRVTPSEAVGWWGTSPFYFEANSERAKLGYTAHLEKGDGYFYFHFGALRRSRRLTGAGADPEQPDVEAVDRRVPPAESPERADHADGEAGSCGGGRKRRASRTKSRQAEQKLIAPACVRKSADLDTGHR